MVEISSTTNEAAVEAVRQKEELIVFYKLGFLDAYLMCNDIKITGNTKRGRSKEANLYMRIDDKCRQRFEARFSRGIEKQIQKVKKVGE